MNRINILLIVLLITAVNADAQTISQTGYVRIMPLFQGWWFTSGNDFAELSVSEIAYIPLRRNLSMTLRGGQATIGGDNLQRLSGVTDTQLAFNYYLEPAKLLFNLGLNLPSGKKELTLQEFQTDTLISKNIFNLQVPNFGQGFNFSSGLTWVMPLNENVVIGLGASYQFKGKFKPLSVFVEDYNPGDEFLATGGIDLRLNETTTITSDVIFTIFGKDKIGQTEVFAPGNKLVANFQFRKYFNFDEFWFYARYRTRAKNDLAQGGVLVPEKEKIDPDQFEIRSHYRLQLSRNYFVRFSAEGRFFQKTKATFSGINLYGFGLGTAIPLSYKAKLPISVKYLIGKFKNGSKIMGLEGGIGIALNF